MELNLSKVIGTVMRVIGNYKLQLPDLQHFITLICSKVP